MSTIMSMFPHGASEFALATATAVAENKAAIERLHIAAEHTNRLFAFSHVALSATAKNLFDERAYAAFVSGIRAYEVVGLGEMTPEEHAKYSTAYAFSILAQTEPDGNFDLHFLEETERSLEDMTRDTPLLSQAVEMLASTELDDSSRELGRFALCGAAAIRDGQLEIDQMLAFEHMLLPDL